MLRLAAITLGMFSLVGGPAAARPASASTINVACSGAALITAIETANNEGTNPGPDTLELTAGCTYALTSAYSGGPNGLPTITTDITINGNGSTIARDLAAAQFRIFQVPNGGAFTLDGLTLTGGHAPDGAPGQSGANGGAIYVCCSGSLNVANVRVTTNRAGDGGEPAIPNGIAGSGGGGGGIFVSGSVSVDISNSSIDGNRAGDGADGNNGGGGGGGGGLALSTSLSVVIVNSTIADNVAGNGGAGTNIHGGGGKGGGIFGPAMGSLIVTTISGNSSGFSGGGVPASGGGIGESGGEIKNSIVANNLVGANCFPSFGGASTNNMASDASCGASFTQKTPAEINLGPLAANGGPTPTMALIYPSSAIDAGDNATCAAAPVNNLDQRGVIRPLDGDLNTTAICDIGAYEAGTQTGPTFYVNSTAGDNDGRCHPASEGDCTLREAITAANADGVPSTVVLGNAQTYTLTVADNANNGLPVISTPITVNGNGSTIARDPGAARFRLITVTSTGSLALDHLTLTGGNPPNKTAVADADGAGIQVDSGSLILTAVTVSGNTAGNGRAASTGTVGGNGGGIYLAGSASSEITDSTISGNAAGLGGGGNTGSGGAGGSGGGIFVTGTASLTLLRSTVTGNNAGDGGSSVSGTGGAGGGGGGIFVNSSAFASIGNSTITQNTAGDGGDRDGVAFGARGSGGGLRSVSAAVYLANDTFAGNARGSIGGTTGTGGNISTSVAIAAANTLAANPTVGENCAATFTASTNNMASDATCGASFLTQTAGQINLGALANNGGPTQTMALITPSSAMDAGDNTTCAAGLVNNVDQRGSIRPVTYVGYPGVCDIGSFELCADIDMDLVCLVQDNCSDVANADQTDSDGDGVGDACDLYVDTTSDATHSPACTTAPGDCSLRDAITISNAGQDHQAIKFNIPPGGPQTITVVGSALPVITDRVIIDATTQPGYSGSPIIELNGNNAVGTGLDISSNVIGNVVRGFVINRFTSNGIRIGAAMPGQGHAVVANNYIGTDLTGTVAQPNGNGILIASAANCIGGIFVADSCQQGNAHRNVISGNTLAGIHIGDSPANYNHVVGNFIGTDVTGSADLGNARAGVSVSGVGNEVGGSLAGQGNLISGNDQGGVTIANFGNVVLGNMIGTAADGSSALGNTGAGVSIGGILGFNNVVGGIAAGEGNTIAFNSGDGVQVTGVYPTGNRIRANSIHSNGLKGIETIGGGNGLVPEPPVITALGSASGTACANCIVDVYSDEGDEGRIYHGTVIADDNGNGSGDWSFPGAVSGPNVTATATTENSTSEFSAAFPFDNDLDGVPNSGDNCPGVANPGQENTDAYLAANGAGQGSGNPPPPLPADALGDACDTDDDNDGFTDTVELAIGTNALDNCPAAGGPGTNGDSWPLDNVVNGIANVLDLLSYKGKTPDNVPPQPKRLDLDDNNVLNVFDILLYKGKVPTSCT